MNKSQKQSQEFLLFTISQKKIINDDVGFILTVRKNMKTNFLTFPADF